MVELPYVDYQRVYYMFCSFGILQTQSITLKTICLFVCFFIYPHSYHAPHTRSGVYHRIQGSQCHLRAVMLWGTCDFLYVTDCPGWRLGSVLQKRGLDSGMTSLLAYSTLSKQNLDRKRINYKLRPKW